MKCPGCNREIIRYFRQEKIAIKQVLGAMNFILADLECKKCGEIFTAYYTTDAYDDSVKQTDAWISYEYKFSLKYCERRKAKMIPICSNANKAKIEINSTKNNRNISSWPMSFWKVESNRPMVYAEFDFILTVPALFFLCYGTTKQVRYRLKKIKSVCKSLKLKSCKSKIDTIILCSEHTKFKTEGNSVETISSVPIVPLENIKQYTADYLMIYAEQQLCDVKKEIYKIENVMKIMQEHKTQSVLHKITKL